MLNFVNAILTPHFRPPPLQDVISSNFSFNMLDVALHAVASLALFYLLQIIGRRLPSKSKNSPFPPGPKRLPLIGSLLQMPSTYFWLTYTKWARLYGDIVYTSICGNQILLLNSAEVVFDLLDKRSMIYSDRPQLPMLELFVFSFKSRIIQILKHEFFD